MAEASHGATVAAVTDLREQIPHREAAEAFVTRICFKLGPPQRIGLELEWLVHDGSDPRRHVDAARLAAALGPLAPASLTSPAAEGGPPPQLDRGSTVTVEPGGQIELSSPAATSLPELFTTVSADAAQLHGRLAVAGLTPGARAVDAAREPRRILDSPRYAAMEAQFDRRSPAGRTMMCATAAAQPCLDVGTAADVDERWHTLHDIGPALVAVFANGSVAAGRDTGWKSARQASWLDIDPSRTRAPAGTDAREAYARFALDARVLLIRGPGRWRTPSGLSFADWIAGATGERPTYADLAYHLTTLFPPVRAHGHFEVRYLDAQPGDEWVVPMAVVWALTRSATARDTARAAAAPTSGRWVDAARFGLDDPDLARAGRALLAAAMDELNGVHAPITQRVAAYAERYTLRGRCPGDDEGTDQ